MKKDPCLKELFDNYQPQLGDSEEYMQRLSQKLDTVEPARRYYSRERRRMQSSLLVAFLSGIPVGVAMAVFLIFHPLVLHFTARWWSLPLFLWFARHASAMLSVVIVLASAAGVAYVCVLFYNLFTTRTTEQQ